MNKNYYSNCLIGVLYLKYKYPNSKIHIKYNKSNSPFPHFCLEYKNKVLWFKGQYCDEPWYKHLWYRGCFTFKTKRRSGSE